MPFDPHKDFAPVTNMVSVPNMLASHPSFPARTVQELVATARARPVTFGVVGLLWSAHHNTLALVDEITQSMADYAPEHMRPAHKSMMRIYRDIRFSPDKRPYKTHLSAWSHTWRPSSPRCWISSGWGSTTASSIGAATRCWPPR